MTDIDKGEIDGEMAAELGAVGATLTLQIATEARDFCIRHGLYASEHADDHFNASVMTIMETVIFLSIIGAYQDERQALNVAREVHLTAKGLIRQWAEERRKRRQ